MLKKVNRLQKDKDFAKVFRSSRPVVAGNLSVRMTKKTNSQPSRFGFVISNKIEKRATRRNALKRRLRSMVRDLGLSPETGFDLVVIVRQNYNYPYDFNQIKADLRAACLKLNLFKP